MSAQQASPAHETRAAPPGAALSLSAPQRRAAIYLRVSDPSQFKEGYSYEGQRELAREYCAARGLEVVVEFGDPGKSAWNPAAERRDYRRLLHLCRTGQVDTVVVWLLSRFGRDHRETWTRRWELEDLGIEIVAVSEDIKSDLQFGVSALIASEESKKKSQMARDMFPKAARQGVHFGAAPFGFRAVRELVPGYRRPQSHLEIEPEEARIVRMMWDWVVNEDLGSRRIADRLNEQGIRTRRGYLWAADMVRFVLANPALNGVSRYGRKSKTMETQYTPGVKPKLLNDEEWAALQKRIGFRSQKKPGRPFSSRYLLTTMLRCGYCRGAMTGRQGHPYERTRDGEKTGELVYYPSYWCANWQKSRALCEHSNGHSCQKLDARVLAELRKYIDPAALKALLAPQERPVRGLISRMERMTRELERIDQLFLRDAERADRGTLDEREFALLNQRRREQRDLLEQELKDIRPKVFEAGVIDLYLQIIPPQVEDALTQIERGQIETPQAKALLQKFVKAIYVKRDGPLEIVFHEPDQNSLRIASNNNV